MNATVSTKRHKNVLDIESQYVVIKTEKGSVMIKSGDSTLKKLTEIGIEEVKPLEQMSMELKPKSNEVGGKK